VGSEQFPLALFATVRETPRVGDKRAILTFRQHPLDLVG